MMLRYVIITVLLLFGASSMHAQYWRLLLPRTAYTVQVNPLDHNKLYVGSTYDQLWRSDDAGVSWERFVIHETQTDYAMTSMVVSEADTSVVLFGGYLFDGIKRSVDGGRTVTRVLNDTTHRRVWFVSEAIVEDPSNPRILYAARGASENTIYRSTDIGSTWDSIGVIDRNLTSRLCTIAIRPDSSNIIFVGATRGTIHRSDDSGRTFRSVPVVGDKLSIRDDSEVPKIVFSPSNPIVGYAVVAIADPSAVLGNGGLLKTTNGGASWNRAAFPDTSLWAVEVRASSTGSDDVFVGGFRLPIADTVIKGDSLVARSLDGGETWTQFKNIAWRPNEDGDSTANVWAMRYNRPSDRLYMATNCGLFVFEEATSVLSDATAHTTLQATVHFDVLHLVDSESWSGAKIWAVYGMSGSLLATGRVDETNALSLDLSNFANGVYFITWGTTSRIRTGTFTVAR